jgi:hypothetical protein
MRKAVLGISILLSGVAMTQDLGSPSVRGELELPVQLGNRDFKNFTESVLNMDLSFNYPIADGFGLGVGGKGGFHTLNIGGDIYRGVGYVKAYFDNRLGPSTLLETSFKYGRAFYFHQADACNETKEQEGNHFDLGVALHFFANEFTSFGLSIGYEIDSASFGSDLVCATGSSELYSNTGGNYKYLNIGLGFNVLFGKRPANGPGNAFD